jgi:hypothetical protein
MTLRSTILGAMVLVFVASCSKSENSAGELLSGTSGGATVEPGSGFSADLARELEPGRGSADSGSAGAASGSAASSGSGTGSGSADRTSAGSAVVATGSAVASSAAGSDAAKPVEPGKADATGSAGDAGEIDMTDEDPEPPSEPIKPRPGAKRRGPVRVPPELAAIKLALLPNWDRDVDEPGTFQYVVRIKGTQSTKTFTFRYGYDDPKAPTDREQYKKFLQESKLMVGEIKDRQRGAAWFLEGRNASGPVFRYMVLYGGKRLVCYGSMYKDAESNRLADDRDQTVIQAKQICETLAL